MIDDWRNVRAERTQILCITDEQRAELGRQIELDFAEVTTHHRHDDVSLLPRRAMLEPLSAIHASICSAATWLRLVLIVAELRYVLLEIAKLRRAVATLQRLFERGRGHVVHRIHALLPVERAAVE
jgi:hypothetical protein